MLIFDTSWLPGGLIAGFECCRHWSAPLELNRSRGGYYRPPGVMILELRRAQLAER
jgi:hypothetical protein